jgi:hypothetical protein
MTTTRREVDGETVNEDAIVDHPQSLQLGPIEDDRSSLAKDSKPMAV